LGVDQHRVHTQRVNLPFEPDAIGLAAATAVTRVTVLEHETLNATRTRLLAQSRQFAPARACLGRRKAEQAARHSALKQSAPLGLRVRANIFAL
jgi:hypothetical protein